MTTLTLTSLSKSTVRGPFLQGAQAKKRWLHQSVTRQAIMMPAMSPFMTEGTITRWEKKEGDAFLAGDVLLQVTSDIATVDVKAESPGILGKILLPDGSTNVPVEKVIALVVRDDRELSKLSVQSQAQAPAASPSNPVSPRVATPSLPIDHQHPFMSSAHRSPSLFELHTMEYPPNRRTIMKHARRPSLSIVPPSPQTTTYMLTPSVSLSSSKINPFHSHEATEVEQNNKLDNQMDGATIRRTIALNLARKPISAGAFDRVRKCDTQAYFDGIL